MFFVIFHKEQYTVGVMLNFFLSKFIPLFIYPVGLMWILLLLALGLRKRPGWQRMTIIVTIALIWIGGNTWVADSLTRALEWQYLPSEETPHAEVIVLLSGGTEPAQYPRNIVEVNGSGDRVIYAADLYHQGAAPNILASGGSVPLVGPDTTESEDMAVLLAMLGVPTDAIWLEKISRNTDENAQFSWEFLSEKDIETIILVTSARHMPRAVRLFEAQGFDVIPAPTDYNITAASWQQLWEPNFVAQLFNFFPTASNLSSTTGTIKEYLGILYYAVQGAH